MWNLVDRVAFLPDRDNRVPTEYQVGPQERTGLMATDMDMPLMCPHGERIT